jgi:hypothetical protein
MPELKEGEKYLNISIGGKEGFKLALFPNAKKQKPTDPDFVGNIGIACWVSKKKPKQPEVINIGGL